MRLRDELARFLENSKRFPTQTKCHGLHLDGFCWRRLLPAHGHHADGLPRMGFACGALRRDDIRFKSSADRGTQRILRVQGHDEAVFPNA